MHGLQTLRKGNSVEGINLLEEAVADGSTREAVAARLVLAIAYYKAHAFANAIPHLEAVVKGHGFISEDRLFERYALPDDYYTFDVVVSGIAAPGGVEALSPIYLLAGCYCEVDQRKKAVGVLQQVAASDADGHIAPTFLLLLLCSLYGDLQDWDEIVRVGSHFQITNVDDTTLMIRLMQAAAITAQGHLDAALEVYKDCLRSSKRQPALLQAARLARAELNLVLGKKAMARRDLARVYAANPDYPGLKDAMARAENV